MKVRILRKPGLLAGYTRGSDGIYRKLVEFPGGAEILKRSPDGLFLGAERVTVLNGKAVCTHQTDIHACHAL
jgi:hypothetical protein